MRTKNLIHPGEILQEEFLVPLGISQTRLALDLHVPAPRINAIVRGKRAITADTALRLGQYFKMEPQFWLNLQANYGPRGCFRRCVVENQEANSRVHAGKRRRRSIGMR